MYLLSNGKKIPVSIHQFGSDTHRSSNKISKHKYKTPLWFILLIILLIIALISLVLYLLFQK